MRLPHFLSPGAWHPQGRGGGGEAGPEGGHVRTLSLRAQASDKGRRTAFCSSEMRRRGIDCKNDLGGRIGPPSDTKQIS